MKEEYKTNEQICMHCGHGMAELKTKYICRNCYSEVAKIDEQEINDITEKFDCKYFLKKFLDNPNKRSYEQLTKQLQSYYISNKVKEIKKSIRETLSPFYFELNTKELRCEMVKSLVEKLEYLLNNGGISKYQIDRNDEGAKINIMIPFSEKIYDIKITTENTKI